MLLVAALLTMLVGILGAIAQSDIKRLLSFTLVSHIGYMVFGVALSSELGMSGAIYYVAHHILVQTTLFLVVGLIERQAGASTLQRLGGLAAASPLLAFVFVVPALNLGGIPPFSGFIGKVALLEAGAQNGSVLAWMLVGGGVVTSLLTLYVVSRVWTKAFWRSRADAPEGASRRGGAVGAARRHRGHRASPTATTSGGCRSGMLVPTGALIAVGLALTVLAGPIVAYSDRAAAEVLDRDRYISAVLGGATPMRTPRCCGYGCCAGWCWCGFCCGATSPPANIIGGLAVALVITLLLPLPAVPVEGRVHPLSLLRLMVGRRLLAGAVVAAGGLAGDQTGAAAAHRGAARTAGDQVGSGAGAGRQHLQPHSRIDGAGDRPGAAADLRARHRRRLREGRRPASTARSSRWSGCWWRRSSATPTGGRP